MVFGDLALGYILNPSRIGALLRVRVLSQDPESFQGFVMMKIEWPVSMVNDEGVRVSLMGNREQF